MIDIKDTSGNIRFSTPINKGSKRRFLLMREDYITLKFSLNDPIYFHLGDGIDNEFGIFELVDLYKPVYNRKTDGYDYELRLDAYYWKWKNKKFFFTPEQAGREASWNLTATLNIHMEVFLKNLEALGYKYRDQIFECFVDDTVEISSKPISYDNCNLIDALTQMAEAWECEWWITDHTIRFGRCEYSDPVDFKLDDNVASMDRSDSQSTYATRIYAFGSTRNIPKTYRKKLVFDVKEVGGRIISDTERRLKSEYFPLDSLLVKNKNIYHSSEKKNNEQVEMILEHRASFHLNDYAILPKGDYILKIENLRIECSANSGRPCQFYKKVEFTYSDKKTVLIDEVKETVNHDLSVLENWDFKFNLESNAFTCNLSFYASVDRCQYAGKINFYVKGTLENEGKGASASVTFVSGIHEGNSFTAIYNPDFVLGEDANVLQLPEGITASLGDRYTIDNIIKSKVPDKYFSKDDYESSINGVVQTRLMLPVEVPYVDAYPDMNQEEAIEEIVVFDDVYAKYVGSVSEAPDPEFVDELVDDKPTGNKFPIYTIKDKELKNFSRRFRLDDFRVVFQTGKLIGLDFAIDLKKDGDDTGTAFDIIPNENYGISLPNDQLFPQAKHMEEQTEVPADTYILYGFDTAFLSDDMLPDAEKELLEKAKKYVERSKIDPSTYNCKMVPAYVYNDKDTKTFELGDRVNLINKTYFENGRQSRIIGYECSLDIPYDQPIYIVGETAAYSRFGEIESKVDSLTYKGQKYNGISVGGTGVYVIGVNDKTLPSDRNTFSAKRILNEIKERALSRIGDDSASGLITFLNGLSSLNGMDVVGGIATDTLTATEITTQILNALDKLIAKDATFSDDVSSADYAEKLLGWMINASGDIDAKSLRLRDFLEVPEFRYNRVSIVSGESWNAPGGGIVEAVDTVEGILYLKLEPGERADVEADDICKASFNDETGFRTAYFRITEKLGDTAFKYVLRSETTFHPCKAMHFVSYGNFTNSDRQKSSYSAQNYVRYLTGVNGWEIRKEMIAMQLGDLSNLKLFGIDMTGHSAYLRNIYMTGVIRQLSDDGVTESRVPCFKGEWTEGDYYHYDEVTHLGSIWLCISEVPTAQEPTEGATDWLEKSAKGKDAVSIHIISSNGTVFQNDSEATTLTAYVIKGEMDITDSIPQNHFSWERKSKYASMDEVFNETHVGHGHVLELASSDLVGCTTFDCIVLL